MSKKNHLLLVMVLCAGFFASTAYAAAIAAGDYFNGTYAYPLVANSKNMGRSWHYAINSATDNLPADFKNGQFFTASCSGQHCVAAGYYYYESMSSAHPLVANSEDGGDTWKYSIDSSKPKLPVDFLRGQFFGSTCSGLFCVAVGYYHDNTMNAFPLIASSSDGGHNWAYVIDSSKPSLPREFKSGQFTGVSCSRSNCVAAGYYNDYPGIPLLANSKDGGQTWVYSTAIPKLPEDFKWGSFASASCSGLNCVAVGTYGTDNDQSSHFGYPLLVNSKDGGETWTFSIDSAVPALPKGFKRGQFLEVSCSKLHCVAAGFYLDKNSNTYPLVANSKDGGINWRYSFDSTTPALPDGFKSGEFFGVSCSGLYCVAAGAYDDMNNRRFPLLVNSKDGGAHWVDSIGSSVPPDLQEGAFAGVSCKKIHCIAAGSYSSGTYLYPLLANSKDGGSSWTYAIDSSDPNLPTDFENGGFFSTNN